MTFRCYLYASPYKYSVTQKYNTVLNLQGFNVPQTSRPHRQSRWVDHQGASRALPSS